MHNVVIFSIKDANGNEIIPSTVNIGYDDPRSYLPKAIVALLDFDPRTGDAATQARSSTSITPEHRRAFEALLAGGTGFALVSCFVNATPTAAIVAMTEACNGDICIAPVFVAVTDDMTLTDHSGTPAHADAAIGGALMSAVKICPRSGSWNALGSRDRVPNAQRDSASSCSAQ